MQTHSRTDDSKLAGTHNVPSGQFDETEKAACEAAFGIGHVGNTPAGTGQQAGIHYVACLFYVGQGGYSLLGF
ncbi:MAG: hypothetical protein EOO39_13285 [Cytophagaceae bacterium]|nr:MAG: hypothetical protein EOO39_13285 [Cytophagaceae bacterium]